MKSPALFFACTLAANALPAVPEIPAVKFRAQTIDPGLQIGYGVAISDVDGDGRPDILLADSRETHWYHNPGWEKHVLTGSLTPKDHVCIAARDLDGDSKAEVAVGAEWNPGDTVNSGAVFTLERPSDPATPWKATSRHREPTVHRMNWVQDAGKQPFLAVLPLHGAGNKNGEGEGIRFLGYHPAKESGGNWENFLIHQGFHMAHNFQPVIWEPGDEGESLLVAEKEGVHLLSGSGETWKALRLTGQGCGEVQVGKLPDGGKFLATIEPMHGNQVAVYPEESKSFRTRVAVDDSLNQGHALVARDFLGLGYDQVAAGWREPDKNGKTGIRLYGPVDESGKSWKLLASLDDGMACEDMKAADLDGDGKPELIASGRATKNLVIYWNETERP